MKKKKEVAVFGAGCFWGVEYVFEQFLGVLKSKVGYMGGSLKNPKYEEVCSGNTEHAEVVRIEYDPEVISYRKLLDIFFRCHDATTLDRQGPDIGNQYRSVIFYLDKRQKKTAQRAKREYEKKIGEKIMTVIEEAKKFYEAEENHQKYYRKKGAKPYCHIIPKI